MKIVLKIFLVLLAVVLSAIIGLTIYSLAITSGVKLENTKLVSTDKTVSFYYSDNTLMADTSNNIEVTEISSLPDYVKNSFIAIEDKRFYSHHGVDYKGLFRAIFNNIKSFSFKEGASTISQQLIKNTHLSNEKTFKRKLVELKLAKQLEKQYSKDEILEMYINSIYYGDNCHGITSASAHYFSKKPDDLTINESAILAGLIKAPSYYSPTKNKEKCKVRKNIVLKKMFEQGYITKSEYDLNAKQEVTISQEQQTKTYDYMYIAKKELNEIIDKYPYSYTNCKVYTNCDKKAQQILSQVINGCDTNTDKSAVLLNDVHQIIAYENTCGEIYRQMASTIKPLLVYAPAIETDTVNSCTFILDEKTDFNGYCPSNFNDKYYGKVSVKTALSKSLNVPAVKLLNYTGIEKSLSYLKKTDIQITENDRNLSIALGSTEKGATLSQITSAYSVFNDNGYYQKASCINTILDKNNQVIYKNNNQKTKVFSDDTVSIINYMTNDCAKTGTAKNLCDAKINLYAKTGTSGNKNGNTDAYCMSYNKDYVLGFWIGNKDNSLMDNSYTGGSIPTRFSAEIWKNLYTDKVPIDFSLSRNVVKEYIDLISYKQENKIILADTNAPNNYKQEELFKISNLPKEKSTRFSSPEIEEPKISVNNSVISISLCLAEYVDVDIYRTENNKKTKIYSTEKTNCKTIFTDNNVKDNTIYIYSVVPFYNSGEKKYCGKEITLPQIKTSKIIDDNWWIE